MNQYWIYLIDKGIILLFEKDFFFLWKKSKKKKKRKWFDHFPVLIATSFYVYIRLILDHPKFDKLQQKEIAFCSKLFRDKVSFFKIHQTKGKKKWNKIQKFSLKLSFLFFSFLLDLVYWMQFNWSRFNSSSSRCCSNSWISSNLGWFVIKSNIFSSSFSRFYHFFWSFLFFKFY